MITSINNPALMHDNHIAIPNDEEYFVTEWERWKEVAQAGNGEFREIAIERLKECIRNDYSILDLSDLGLMAGRDSTLLKNCIVIDF